MTQEQIDHYLRTGESEPSLLVWSRPRDDLREALIDEVKRRAGALNTRPLPEPDITALTRRKVQPMVNGLFPQAERDTVLATLENSVVFVTSDNFEQVLRQASFARTAWDLANLYLLSLGVDPFGHKEMDIVGLSQWTTCFVSVAYFAQTDPFADYIVHEAAHIFHNCKRKTLDLPATRRREWLLDIDYRKRETFAYACEAYSRILERSDSRAKRLLEASQFAKVASVADDRVDATEVASIVAAAAAARNGWKAILERCSRPHARRPLLNDLQ